MRLENKIAVITGAGSGLGRAMALRFAEEGATVLTADIAGKSAERVAAEIVEAGGRALPMQTDVTNTVDVQAMVDTCRQELGRVDILVNNAARATDTDLHNMSEENWDRDVDITLKGTFLCSQAVLPEMIANGSGVILNISSVNALAYYGNEAYSAAKAGVLSFTRSLAVRYGPSGIRANAIAPGSLRTPAWEERQKQDPNIFESVAKWYPLGRIGEPKDVVGPAIFLVSEEAGWVSGAVLPVDGGLGAGNLQMTQHIVKGPQDQDL